MNCNLCRYYNPNYDGCVIHTKIGAGCGDFSPEIEVAKFPGSQEKEIISAARDIIMSVEDIYMGFVASIRSAISEIQKGESEEGTARIIADRIIGRGD